MLDGNVIAPSSLLAVSHPVQVIPNELFENPRVIVWLYFTASDRARSICQLRFWAWRLRSYRFFPLANIVTAVAVMIPPIITTTPSSITLNPASRLRFFGSKTFIFYALVGAITRLNLVQCRCQELY